MSKEPDTKTATAVIEEKTVEPLKPPAIKAVKVKLIAPHRHNGNDCAVDAELVVDADAATFITDNKIGVVIK